MNIPVVVLQRTREFEVDGKGKDAESIHAALKARPGFGGVTVRAGKVYVTFAHDLDVDELRSVETGLAAGPAPI